MRPGCLGGDAAVSPPEVIKEVKTAGSRKTSNVIVWKWGHCSFYQRPKTLVFKMKLFAWVNFLKSNRPSWGLNFPSSLGSSSSEEHKAYMKARWMMFLLDSDESQHDDGRTPAFPLLCSSLTFHLLSFVWIQNSDMQAFSNDRSAYLVAYGLRLQDGWWSRGSDHPLLSCRGYRTRPSLKRGNFKVLIWTPSAWDASATAEQTTSDVVSGASQH